MKIRPAEPDKTVRAGISNRTCTDVGPTGEADFHRQELERHILRSIALTSVAQELPCCNQAIALIDLNECYGDLSPTNDGFRVANDTGGMQPVR